MSLSRLVSSFSFKTTNPRALLFQCWEQQSEYKFSNDNNKKNKKFQISVSHAPTRNWWISLDSYERLFRRRFTFDI